MRFRYSLRLLILTMLMAAIVCGVSSSVYQSHRRAVLKVAELKGQIRYYENNGFRSYVDSLMIPMFGQEGALTVREVYLGGWSFDHGNNTLNAIVSPVTDADLAVLGNFPYLERLNLGGSAITDQGLQEIQALKSLRILSLSDTHVTEEGVHQLVEALPELISLSIHNIDMSDQSQDRLRHLLPADEWRIQIPTIDAVDSIALPNDYTLIP